MYGFMNGIAGKDLESVFSCGWKGWPEGKNILKSVLELACTKITERRNSYISSWDISPMDEALRTNSPQLFLENHIQWMMI